MADIGRATAKWAQRASQASDEYRTGVQGKGAKWQQNALASEQTYAAAMQEAISEGRRSQGIQRAGGTAWEQGAVQKGAQNYSTGVRSPVAQQKYGQNFGPVLSSINSAVQSLPPRGLPMSEENFNRQRSVAEAAHNASKARRGGGFTPSSSSF